MAYTAPPVDTSALPAFPPFFCLGKVKIRPADPIPWTESAVCGYHHWVRGATGHMMDSEERKTGHDGDDINIAADRKRGISDRQIYPVQK